MLPLWKALVNTAEDGELEVLDVDNVCGGVLVSSRTSLFLLIELVVQKEVLVVLSDPALVSVCGTVVGGARQLARHGSARDINDGKSILVVVEADLTTLESLLGSTVDNTLSIVDIAIRSDTASILGSLGVGHIDHPKTSTALEIVGSTNSSNKGGLLISDNVVAVAETAEVSGQVTPDAEGRRVLGVGVEKLGQVKDLQTVASGFRADVGVVANDLDVAP
ncbi:hypothetical protein HG531_005890 [Fusarium graminearum]|nr:hypothetical protein HG531_005890 [Fusarium graminearum]